jgi:hypothetical protein
MAKTPTRPDTRETPDSGNKRPPSTTRTPAPKDPASSPPPSPPGQPGTPSVG